MSPHVADDNRNSNLALYYHNIKLNKLAEKLRFFSDF